MADSEFIKPLTQLDRIERFIIQFGHSHKRMEDKLDDIDRKLEDLRCQVADHSKGEG
jgi:hypothetical protein